MTDFDFIQICRTFQRLEDRNNSELVYLENTYQIFHRFDEYDLLNLLEAQIYSNCLKDIEREVIRLCDYLLKYGDK